MQLPFVIDNREHKLADILNELLARFEHRSVDIATAYFTVGGFELLRDGLARIGSLRLLLGAEPQTGEHLGLRPHGRVIACQLRADLEASPYDERTLRLVEDLIAYLRRDGVDVRLVEKGFLHAKCYLIYGDRPSGQAFLFDRFQPLIGIVGSSNFTRPGLTSNRELNLSHRVLLGPDEAQDEHSSDMVSFLAEQKASPRITDVNRQLIKSEVGARAILELVEWFNREWDESRDFKNDLIKLLDASKFGQQEYTPYQVYLKALYEYFRDDLAADEGPQGKTSAVDLAQFQEDAVKRARKILAVYHGVMIADSVGLGKTWIGKKLLEDFAYHMRQKALVVCPASLRDMWTQELRDVNIAAAVVSQEELGRTETDLDKYGDADVVLIDESHNFRNRNAQRYNALDRILSLNGNRGRAGQRKKIVLLTATPINNDMLDLYHQLNLITRNDPSYFASMGIGNLHRYFLRARRESTDGNPTVGLFNLLDEIVIRRTRPYIKQAYPDATIRGRKITFPERRLKTENYNLEAVYQGIYADIVRAVESLHLAPYNLESYKRPEKKVDEFEAGREEALVGIFKSRYLKRLESSIDGFRISVRRALAFQKTFESYLLGGRLLRSTDFQKAMQYLQAEDEEDDALPRSEAAALDGVEEARAVLANMDPVDPRDYDLRRLHDAVQADIDALTEVWERVKDITSDKDAKLAKLRELMAGPLRGRKCLIFTYYRDTARYLHRWFESEAGCEFLAGIGNPVIRRLDSGASPSERRGVIERFAPLANQRPDLIGGGKEIDILISTDVLSEGQNLQDCAHLVNYDLHWNPTRMVQRAGRIDRIGTQFDTLYIHNMFPDQGLEELLQLVERLATKIAYIDSQGFLDASVLGETVHPRNFNIIRRIRDEDGTVVEEQEQFAELATNEGMLLQLKAFLAAEGSEKLGDLPDGIHSGLARRGARGMFFYFQAPRPDGEGKLHFWRYFDLNASRIVDNRFLIAQLIACSPDTQRVIGDYDVFDIQEKVIADILNSIQEQQALEVAPRTVDAIQATVGTLLQGYLNSPEVRRADLLTALKFLNQPMSAAQVKELRRLYNAYGQDRDVRAVLTGLLALRQEYGERDAGASTTPIRCIKREDLRLICFEHVVSGG